MSVQDGPTSILLPVNLSGYSYPFPIRSSNPKTDIQVSIWSDLTGTTKTLLTYGSNFVVNGDCSIDPPTTRISLNIAVTAGQYLFAQRVTALTRPTDFDNFAAAPMGQIDADLDRVYMALQELAGGATTLITPGTINEISGYTGLLPNENAVHNALDDHAELGGAHGATAVNTPNVIMRRDGNGNVSITPGTQDNHAATKSQADAARNASNLTSGVVPIARIPDVVKDADTLDGQHGAFYQNASNLNAGIIQLARLPNGALGGMDAEYLCGFGLNFFMLGRFILIPTNTTNGVETPVNTLSRIVAIAVGTGVLMGVSLNNGGTYAYVGTKTIAGLTTRIYSPSVAGGTAIVSGMTTGDSLDITIIKIAN